MLEVYAEFRTDTRLQEKKRSLDDVDLDPLVAEWYRAQKVRHEATAARYLAQIRRLVPEGEPFPVSRFRRKVVSEHLAGLSDEQSTADDKPPVSASTRNRHRAALRQFGKWLVEREVLETNPVRDVAGSRENPGRLLFHSVEEQQAIIKVLQQPFKALEAIMAGCGAEWQAVTRLRRRDIDLDDATVELHGSKTPWRNRTAKITEDWTLPAITAYVSGFTPNALLFDGIEDKKAHAAHYAACAAAKVQRSHLHDWRHSYAVMLRRRGVSNVIIARQLGHANTVLVATRYGRFEPDTAEVTRAAGGLKNRAARRQRA